MGNENDTSGLLQRSVFRNKTQNPKPEQQAGNEQEDNNKEQNNANLNKRCGK